MTKPNYKYKVHLPQSDKTSSPPRAIVFVFGWAFSTMKHVLKYSELYQEKGCATVTGVLPPQSVAVKNDTVIREFCDGAMEEAAKLIRQFEQQHRKGPPIPILVQALCNGGGFCRMGIHEAVATKQSESRTTHQLIRERLAAEVLDSAPVYISTRSSLAALAGVVKNPLVFWMLAIGGTLANYVKYFWSLASTKEAFYVTYWNQMKASDVCPHQFFVYSSADTVCDHTKVDEFVEYRRSKGTGSVTVMKVSDTGHCRHLQGHQKKYSELVDTAIEKAIAEMELRERDRKRSRM